MAFARKNDIQDIEYLRERQERYHALADEYHFKVINGDQSPELVLKDAIDIVSAYDKR